MIYTEKVEVGSSDLLGHVKKVLSDLFASRLTLEGTKVTLPNDVDYEVKTKFSDDEAGGAVTIKINWEKIVEATIEEEQF